MKTVSAVEFVIIFHLFFCNDLLTCDTLAAGNSIFQDVTIRDDEVIICNMIISIIDTNYACVSYSTYLRLNLFKEESKLDIFKNLTRSKPVQLTFAQLLNPLILQMMARSTMM